MSAEPEAEIERSRLGTALRRLGALAAVGFIALLAYGLAARSPDTSIDDALARAQSTPAPGFTLDLFDRGKLVRGADARLDAAARDGRVSLAELRGTPVVVNFWASWCDPCRTEALVLEAGWRRAERQGVLFVGINMQDVPGDAREFLRTFEVSYPTLRDRGKTTSRRYGATGIPETFFISARGDVVAHVLGTVTREQLDDGVDAARAGRPATTVDGGARQAPR